jgi:hypothetical protein
MELYNLFQAKLITWTKSSIEPDIELITLSNLTILSSIREQNVKSPFFWEGREGWKRASEKRINL